MSLVLVVIGNTDQKISHSRWVELQQAVSFEVQCYAVRLIGDLVSVPTHPLHQRVMMADVASGQLPGLMGALQRLGKRFNQGSIVVLRDPISEEVMPLSDTTRRATTYPINDS